MHTIKVTIYFIALLCMKQGAWEVKIWLMTDRPTDRPTSQPTNQQTNTRARMEVSLPKGAISQWTDLLANFTKNFSPL